MPSPTRTPGQPDLADVARTPGQPDLAGLDAVPGAAGPWLVTVPSGWPPYDCDAYGAAGARGAKCAACAACAACPAAGEPGVADPPADAPPPAEPSAAPSSAPPPLAPPPPDGQDQAAGWPGQFAQVIVEILAGSRPSRQIAPWTTERVRARVDGLARRFASDQRPRLRRMVTSRPAAAVVEMTVVVGFGPRSRALAMRFEHVPERRPAPGLPGRPARWLCTEMEAG